MASSVPSITRRSSRWMHPPPPPPPVDTANPEVFYHGRVLEQLQYRLNFSSRKISSGAPTRYKSAPISPLQVKTPVEKKYWLTFIFNTTAVKIVHLSHGRGDNVAAHKCFAWRVRAPAKARRCFDICSTIALRLGPRNLMCPLHGTPHLSSTPRLHAPSASSKT